jgi:hypothetical protein
MKQFLHHLFLPKETNNYRASLLHHKILLIFTLFFLVSGVLMSYVRTNLPSVLGTFSNISSQELLAITNEKRQAIGLQPLGLNDSLSQAAAGKASDMFNKNYWAHVSPDGTTPWVFIKASGYNYIYAGENLARGFTTPAEVVNAWMASPTHRENMLSANYKEVGFAVETGKLNGEDTVLVVEMFGSTSFVPKNVASQEQQKPIEVAVAVESPSTLVTTPSPSTQNPTVPSQNTLSEVNKINVNQKLASTTLTQSKPLINGITFSSASARIIISLFIFVLILDMIIIERKKIVRFVGHNLDHVIFFSLLLLVIVILARGVIL